MVNNELYTKTKLKDDEEEFRKNKQENIGIIALLEENKKLVNVKDTS